MKNNLFKIINIALIIIAIGVIILLIIMNINKNKKKTFRCETKEVNDIYGKYQEIMEFEVNDLGEIVKNTYSQKKTYNDLKDLDGSLEYYISQGKNKEDYQVDREKKTLIYSETTDSVFVLDENQNRKELWYKDYLQSLSQTYQCKQK